jgi:hypothetical protein
LDQLNGGGWVVFIVTNHFLVVASFLPTADGSRTLVRMVCPYTSTTKIATVSNNGYTNDYCALNVSSDVR